jgi:hypothetical protein
MTSGGASLPSGSPVRRRLSWLPEPRIGAVLVSAVVAAAVVVTVVVSIRHSPSGTSQPAAVPARIRPTTGVIDGFARSDSLTGLGQAESGQAWHSVQGTWGVADHAARLVQGAPLKRNLVVIDMGSPDGFVQVTQKVDAAGAGLVFRYRNEFNYWVLRSAPKFATWTVEKVLAGKVVALGNLGSSPVSDGTTVSVWMQGAHLDFYVDGFHRRAITDSDLNNETLVGLSAFGEGVGAARWSTFVASAEREPLPAVTTTVTISGGALAPTTPTTKK